MDSIEKLTIETPEQIDLEFPLAGLGSRGLALLYDSLLQALIALFLFIAAAFFAPTTTRLWAEAWTWTVAVLVLAAFCLYWGYFAFFEAIWKGQTPGKRRARIRVIKETGRSITVFEAVARNFMRAIDALPGPYAVGVAAIFIDRKNRRLGDLVAGTVVVHESRDWAAKPLRNVTMADRVVADSDIAARLTVQELELMETFLARRLDLVAEVRRQTGHAIADRLAAKLNVPPESRPSDEDFLERLAAQYRDAARFSG